MTWALAPSIVRSVGVLYAVHPHYTNNVYVYTPAHNNKNFRSNPFLVMEPNKLWDSEYLWENISFGSIFSP